MAWAVGRPSQGHRLVNLDCSAIANQEHHAHMQLLAVRAFLHDVASSCSDLKRSPSCLQGCKSGLMPCQPLPAPTPSCPSHPARSVESEQRKRRIHKHAGQHDQEFCFLQGCAPPREDA